MPKEKITILDIIKGLIFIAFLYAFCIIFMEILTGTSGFILQIINIENKLLAIILGIIALIVVSFIASLGKWSGELSGIFSSTKVLKELKSRFKKDTNNTKTS